MLRFGLGESSLDHRRQEEFPAKIIYIFLTKKVIALTKKKGYTKCRQRCLLQIAKVLGWSKDPGPTYSAGRLPAILFKEF